MIDKILHKIYDFILSLDKSYGVKKFTQKETAYIQEKHRYSQCEMQR